MATAYSKTYIYTTGEAAKICNLSASAVCKLFDSGKLRGYKLQERGDRRISERSLIEFMVKGKIPIPPEMQDRHRDYISGNGIPHESFVFFQNGINWCCVRPDFINIEESIVGIGFTFREAHVDYLRNEDNQKTIGKIR